MQDHQLALKPGYVLEGFRIERVLGKGGFGITYLAVDVRLGKKVAIKELLPDSIATRVEGSTVLPQSSSQKEDWEWAKERFVEEARMLAGFSHPAIVGVHLLIEANGTAYMVMDYIEGESYEAKLKRIGTESDEAALMAVIGPVLEGLEEVHAKGLLHRDIKPENILIKRNGQPVLIDFGAARESVGQTVTMTSMVTHGYSPIEQYQSKGRMGPWTDIYAVGALMCRAMTGEKPPVAANRVMDEEFEWLSYRDLPGYSAPFRQAVDWALRIKPQERPQSVDNFLTEFRRLSSADTRAGNASQATPETNVEQHDFSAEDDADDSHIALLASSEAPTQASSGSGADPVMNGTSPTKRPFRHLAVLCLIALLAAYFVPMFYAEHAKQDLAVVQASQVGGNLPERPPKPDGIIHVPKDYPTIGTALGAASVGQTVLVAPGVYEECVTMKSGVRLEGEKLETTIIRNRLTPGNVVSANAVFSAALSNFTIEQLLEQRGDDRHSAVLVKNSTITMQHCHIHSSGHGISITGDGDSEVLYCSARDCEWNGITVYANTGQAELRGNDCSENKGFGILVWRDGRARLDGNTCNGNGRSGISVQGTAHADVSDNKCYANRWNGIEVLLGSRAKLISNICSENDQWGIWFASGSEGLVERNICNRNTFGGLACRGPLMQVDIVGTIANDNDKHGIAVERGFTPRSFERNNASGNGLEPQINLSATWND